MSSDTNFPDRMNYLVDLMSSKVTMMAADWANRREGIYALMDYMETSNYEESEDE